MDVFLNMLLTKYMDSTNLDIRAERCTLSRNRFSSCRNCIEHCPSSAITFEKGIIVSNDDCSECMNCTKVCPTEVFSDKKYTSTFGKINKQNPVVFSCIKNESRGRNIQLNCIEDLDIQMLLMCHRFNKEVYITIDDEKCSDCHKNKHGDVQKKIHETITKYDDLVSKSIDIHFIKEDIQSNELYTRRELIESFTKKISDDFVFPLLPDLTDKERLLNKQTIGLKQNLRNNLLKQIGKDCKQEVRPSIFGVLMIQYHHSCNGCKKCEAVCPTASLYVEETENQFTIKQIASKCVGCRACIEICPNQSLITDHEQYYSLAGYIGKQPRDILELEIGTCPKCEGRVYGDSLICGTCNSKEALFSTDDIWK